MKSKQSIITMLNKLLTIELTSINRYFLHARMNKNWGFENLNEKNYKKSILDMKQADDLIERILFLEGLPNLQQLGALAVGESPQEMIDCDIAFQQEQIDAMKSMVELCETEQDFVSREILVNILSGEEEHMDWLEAQVYQIGEMGIANYLQAQTSD